MNIPFTKVSIGPEEGFAVTKVMVSGWLAAGPEVKAFEEEFSAYISPKGEKYYCIFTNSGTSALKMAYKWFKEVAPYGHVWVPSNTFSATYASAEEMGVPWNFINDLEKNKKILGDTQTLTQQVNVHYGSVKDETPCLIEDSAHRIEPKDPLIGKIRCYSFYATKNMTTGSGGMFVTNDKDIYERARLYWKDGLSTTTLERANGADDYDVKVMAGGYDGNDIAAAVGRAQLKKLPVFTTRRNQIRDRYNRALGQSWDGNHLYPYFVDSAGEVRELRKYLLGKGIHTGYHYPGTGWLGVSLPIYPDLEGNEQEYIIRTVLKWQSDQKKMSSLPKRV